MSWKVPGMFAWQSEGAESGGWNIELGEGLSVWEPLSWYRIQYADKAPGR